MTSGEARAPAPAPVRLEVRTASADETRSLAAALAPAFGVGDVVLLVGDLGAGKTTFVQGLASGLGVDESVTSPTFILVRPYRCSPPAGAPQVRMLLHADLYRLDHLREVTELALDELVEDAALAVVEWGDVGAPVLGDDAVVIRMASEDDDEHARVVTVELPAWRTALAEDAAARLSAWGPVRRS